MSPRSNVSDCAARARDHDPELYEKNADHEAKEADVVDVQHVGVVTFEVNMVFQVVDHLWHDPDGPAYQFEQAGIE